MNIEQTTATPPGTVNLSTTLDPKTVNHESGGGAPSLTEPDAKGADDSIESVLDAELKSLREQDAKKDDKPEAKEPEKDAKADEDAKAKDSKSDEPKDGKAARERAEDGKFAKAEKAEAAADGKEGAPAEAAAGQEGAERAGQSEGRRVPEPPARFLPKEKELWANVPTVVKSAVDRLTKEHEAEVTQFREAHAKWQELEPYEQMAKQHQTTVSDALKRYTSLDGLLHSNPIEGIRQILATRGITPEQYAEHVLNNPDAHRAPAPRAAPDPVVQQLLSKVDQLEQRLSQGDMSRAADAIIAPFAAANPRFNELQDDIAMFLQSNKIPASLSPQEKLEAAYDMAVRINPTSAVVASQAPEVLAAKTDPSAKAGAGLKSIRGAPDDGADTEIEEGETDLRSMLRKEMRRMTA